MIKFMQRLGALGVLALFITAHSYALKPTDYPAWQKDYIFIENNIDKEYFIAPDQLDPRFTGSNVWNKYKSRQSSLGYMGTNYPVYKYVDYWTDSTSIDRPYLGSRCWMLASNRCTASGYRPAQKIDAKGAYRIEVIPNDETNGGYARAAFGPNAYEHFRTASLRNLEYIIMNACSTNENYSPAQGTYCKDAKTGRWDRYTFKLNKYGHITLLDTKAFQEIWYGTDGTPYLTANSNFCEYSVVDRQNGISCKMLKYNVQGNPTTFSPYYFLYMVTDNASFGFTPAAADLRIHGGTGAWRYYNEGSRAYNKIKDMMVSGDGYISVFFTNTFFQKLAKAKVNIRNIDGLFTFAVDNNVAPQSGFYQFSVSTKIELIPREYSVSIQPKGMAEGSTPVLTGKIGDSNPITFNYTVRQSAPRQADTIEAYVSAPNIVKNGQSYCSFKSADKRTEVAIPAWLSMQNYYNQEVKAYSGCDANQKLNMRNALWSVVPWDNYGSGYFYSTNLKLLFPMDDNISNLTTDGLEWMGKVRAEGEIKVRAKWIGVTFP